MRPLLASIALLFCACGPLIDAQLSGVEICDDVQTIDVPAAPSEMTDVIGPQTISRSSAWTLSDELRSKLAGQSVNATLSSITLSGDGVDDLSFVKAAGFDATIASQHVALAWDGAIDPKGGVTIRPEGPVDLTGLLSTSSADVTTSITATLPAKAWTLKVRACFTGDAHVTWSP